MLWFENHIGDVMDWIVVFILIVYLFYWSFENDGKNSKGDDDVG